MTPEAEAERLLPCHGCEHWDYGPHHPTCPAYFRSEIAAALRQKDDAIERLRPPHADEDGACSRCGLPWPESVDDGEHVCPPGFWTPMETERDRLRAALENAEKEIQVRDNQITQLLATNDKHVIALENAERERDEEQRAHEEIATLCFAAGVTTDDGTSTSAVKNLIAALAAATQRQRDAVAEIDMIRQLHNGLASCCDCGKRAEKILAILADAKPEGGEHAK